MYRTKINDGFSHGFWFRITIFAVHSWNNPEETFNDDRMKRIQSALISVWDKEGLLPLLAQMRHLGIKIYSTGGTCDYIRDAGYEVTSVEHVTGYPSVFGGRVKTLHPAIMGGILFRRDHPEDHSACEQYNIPAIDLVVVDLYPFRETVETGGSEAEVIEKIDIGGISLIRAAAKNYRDVVVISHKRDYPFLGSVLAHQGETDEATRRMLAGRAFDCTSDYDSAISNYFSAHDDIPPLKVSLTDGESLRYGENPHQKGRFYGNLSDATRQLHGKAISYNNLLDIDAAVKLIDEFTQPTVAILKHNNACGLATRENLTNAWDDALQADPKSAFGGVIVTNRPVDGATAIKISQIFFEVVIAPGFTPEAFELLSAKKNRILLERKPDVLFTPPLRNVLNGFLMQDPDVPGTEYPNLKIVTNRAPDEREMNDLLFANAIVKHTKSNAIVLANGQMMIGSGTGQTSRIDAMKQAIAKAESFHLPLKGAVIASDAFFPFPDNVQVAHDAGIRAIIQPGGSVKDQESVDLCNKYDIAMVFTGIRHFKH